MRRKLWLRNGILCYDCDSYDKGGAWMSHGLFLAHSTGTKRWFIKEEVGVRLHIFWNQK